MKKLGYYLAIEKGRGLVSIGPNNIQFNLNGFILFDTVEELEQFRFKYRYHFFGLETLAILYKKES